ncbi:MAG TPA: UPF0182 family protein [Pyrinomonadaceae bacterium]|nr:UPF0182 family protein [Pyrinomonadaceae bacterium]
MALPLQNFDEHVIDVEPPRQFRWRRWLILAIILAIVFASFRFFSIYLSALWFGSLGYASVYWYMFKLKLGLFAAFALLTFLILRGAFWLLERTFATSALERRTILVNNQPVSISPARIIGPITWVVSIIAALFAGSAMRDSWRRFALYFNQAQTNLTDPIFHKQLGFYLFSLPVHQLLSGWLVSLSFVILCATILLALLSLPQKLRVAATESSRRTSVAAVSVALAAWLLLLAWRFYLSRFPYLWEDHQTFTGASYTEANYLLPGLFLVAIALIAAALISLLNAFTQKRLRLLIVAVAVPILVYIVAGAIVPAYVTSFVVKPNELARETPYIEHNIAWTRKAFNIENIEQREFTPETGNASFDLEHNRATLDNIRLWDWRALQDTLRQIQEIRTYYDFPDVDVDRYMVGGQRRQMMLAPREIDQTKLPEQSRNWINERLIYTHGYGVTMNTSNGFTPEGMPQFVLSNMPIESSAPEIKVTRPEIYFGEKTDSMVYVKTRENEFDYPQGEANNYTTYQGTGGIQIGSGLRRFLLAWALGDFKNLTFSDRITPESRALLNRNIYERVQAIAPFLYYDSDPYIAVSDDGKLYWIIDAFTESSTYPYSRHYKAGEETVNYIRNSCKVVVDAYNGTTSFYVFDTQDPLINSYRNTFPALFRDASEMPADLRGHVRYPETLIKTQGDVFSLYHTQNTKVFFQREDVWSVATQVSLNNQGQHQTEALEPYYVLMQLPGEAIANEFVSILPFTPANRPNMIGWLAGRCDGEHYGSLLIYNFPKSKLVEGPLQIEARIDQNAQLSGQFTLWNQQGSRVRRGNLLVVPIGHSLLYVEPVYLQAERSPMPELRLVVVATQDNIAYGPTFADALASLFGGDAARQPSQGEQQQQGQQRPNQSENPQPSSQPSPSSTSTQQQLIDRAIQEFEEYQRLTAQGKLGEAGQKLEQHRRTLEELKRASSQH